MSVQYTATVKVVLPQLVHCTYCDCKFIYELTVTGTGCAETGLFTSDKAAKKAAEDSMPELLLLPVVHEAVGHATAVL
jgi:hypothetical protein